MCNHMNFFMTPRAKRSLAQSGLFDSGFESDDNGIGMKIDQDFFEHLEQTNQLLVPFDYIRNRSNSAYLAQKSTLFDEFNLSQY